MTRKSNYKHFTEGLHYDVIEGCHLWKRCKNPDGYGQITYQGKLWKAHRLIWVLSNGSIEDNMHILHTCDNPSCCNIKHLKLGTHKDNMLDMFNKGRANRAYGEGHGRVKLSNEEIPKIINLYYIKKYSQQKLGNLFNVSQTHISRIINKQQRIKA
jgi:hypothetical protein